MHKRLQDITACGQKDREETEQQNGRTEQFEPRFLPPLPPAFFRLRYSNNEPISGLTLK